MATKTDRFAEFASEHRPNSGVSKCKVGRILDVLAVDERDATLKALALDSGIENTSLARVLTRWGHKIGDHSIRVHRRGECCCP